MERNNSNLSVVLSSCESEQELRDIADKRAFFLKYSKHCKLNANLDKRELVKDANKSFNEDPDINIFNDAFTEQTQKVYVSKHVDILKNKTRARRVSFSDTNSFEDEDLYPKEKLKDTTILKKVQPISHSLDSKFSSRNSRSKAETYFRNISNRKELEITRGKCSNREQSNIKDNIWEITEVNKRQSLLATSTLYAEEKREESSNDSLATKRSSQGSRELKVPKEKSMLQRFAGFFVKVSVKEKEKTSVESL